MVTKSPATIADHAEAYVKLGLFVLPLWPLNPDRTCACRNPDCKTPGKHPLGKLIPNGVLDASRDLATVRQWWAEWPDANIGIAVAQSGLAVIAPDSPEWMQTFKDNGLPRTAVVRSGGGAGHFHYYYRRTDGCPERRINVSQQYDMLATGLVVAPPSAHYLGASYEWAYPLESVDELPELPAWAVDWLTKHQEADKQRIQFSTNGSAPDQTTVYQRYDKIRGWLAPRIRNAIESGPTAFKPSPGKDGSRSGADAAVVTTLLSMGFSHDLIRGIYQVFPIGTEGKYAERGDAYLALTIAAQEEFLGTIERATPEPETEELPEIDAGNGDLKQVTAEAWAALEHWNEPVMLLRFGSEPVRIERDDDGKPIPRPLTENRLRHELARAANWYKWVKKDGDWAMAPAKPPLDVVRDILAMPDIDLPILEALTEAPIFAADGSLCLQQGYDPGSRTYYAPEPGFNLRPIPTQPSASEIRYARSQIEDMLCDFPFTGVSERAHAIALLLQLFARNLIDGPTPLFLIEKPTPGTGAGLLIETLALVATGHPATMMTEGRDEDEWRKRITATLWGSPQIIAIDNIRDRLDSASLSSALTARSWQDRILGRSEMTRLPVRCAWVATGNNPALSSEITRRTIRIRLDAKTDRPWERTQFRHSDLRGWVRERRGELVWSCLTLIRAWLAAGKPSGSITIGSYEAWARTLGGILQVAGVDGFLANATEFYEQSDTEGSDIRGFLSLWWMQYTSNPVTVAQLFTIAISDDSLLDIEARSVQGQRIKLGQLLQKLYGRHYQITEDVTIRVEKAGTFRQAIKWQLIQV